MPSIDLWFPLGGVIDLARHAAAASSHRAPYGADAVAALIWAHDDGTYLSSSGMPIQPRPDGIPGRKIVRPAGWTDPATWHHISDTPVGGDDFLEQLRLDEPFTADMTLYDAILSAPGAGLRHFIITVTASHVHAPGTMAFWFNR